jgi:hypothetical protein
MAVSPKKKLLDLAKLHFEEKIFQIFQISENDFCKALKINARKAEPEGFEP